MRRHGGPGRVEVDAEQFPACESALDVGVCVLALLVGRVGVQAKVSVLDPASPFFAKSARKGLRLAFGFLS